MLNNMHIQTIFLKLFDGLVGIHGMQSELFRQFTPSKKLLLGRKLHSIFIRSHALRSQFQRLLCLNIRKELLRVPRSLGCLRRGSGGLSVFYIRSLLCNVLRYPRFFIAGGMVHLSLGFYFF